jgi:hypothetical protein
MILLVTASARSSDCAAALNEATGQEIVVAETLHRAATLLRSENYVAVVLDQHLLESEAQFADSMLDQIGVSIPIEVNLGITGMSRLVREVRSGLQRGERAEVRARLSGMAKLHSQLNGTVTALLLSTELALQTHDLPQTAVARLAAVHELVQKLRRQLEVGDAAEEHNAMARG